MLHLYYDPTRNPSGQTLANQGFSMEWLNFAALGNLPLGTIGSSELLSGIRFALRAARLDPQGYVYHHFNGPLWPFPDYTASQGRLKGWEFNGSDTEGWAAVNTGTSTVSGGLWRVELPSSDPQLISPTIAVAASQAHLIEIHLRCVDVSTDCSGAVGQLFWQRQDAPTFSETRSRTFSLLSPQENYPQAPAAYMIPIYEHPEWTGIITRLRFDPVFDGQAGRRVEIDRIVLAYDARSTVNNLNYILSAALFYFNTGEPQVFTDTGTPQGSILDRARQAMNFVNTKMGGTAQGYVYLDWPGHDGLPGKVSGQLNFGHGIQGSIYDIWPSGREDAYASVHYYAALLALADLEDAAAANPQWGVAPNPYGETAATYRQQAAQAKALIDQRFWDSSSGRLGAVRDINGNLRDIGHVGLNLMAIFYDALLPQRKPIVMDWIAGTRTVAGDDAVGSQIYGWTFGPRTNTVDVSDWYIWPMYIWFGSNLTVPPGALWDQQVMNGGGWFWLSFYDLVSRIRIRGPDDAWSRLDQIRTWYAATQAAGGFRNYYQSNPGLLQGCGSAGNIGLDCEFIENALVPLATLYGFLGYRVGPQGLHLEPQLPTHVDELGAQRLHFRKHFYNVRARKNPYPDVTVETYPETGIPGFGNAPHTLPLAVGGFAQAMPVLIRIDNFATGTYSSTTVAANTEGYVLASVAMPADGRVHIAPIVIFSDGFESGSTSAWSVSAP